jgi:RimJ/RimL family protein N-acetyltransferase/predicted GNAT family acetyltransferase
MLERIRGFRRTLQDAVAEERIPFAYGTALFCGSLPIVYDVNYLRVDVLPSAVVLEGQADALMEQFFHRRVVTDGGGGALAGAFTRLGWTRTTHLVMAHTHTPDRIVDTSAAREVTLDELAAPHTRVTLDEPYGTPELALELLAAKSRVAAAADTRFFAVFAGDQVAAYCELRSDGHTAQIEDVNTLAAHRGRGLGRMIVQKALDEALALHDVVFVEALADDWPKELYARLGFSVVDERHLFLRAPHPLTRLRVKTRRLELRLATVAELRELTEVAKAGIHDPGFMPFGVAWTDSLDDQSLVDWHLSALRDWRPYDWRLELVVFHDGGPIGVQGLRGERFGATREAGTGSWLGAAWQGQGLGTEMRAAILTLLFDGLGGTTATSGALDGNEASLAVSRKLGYEHVGRSTMSPRGAPIGHADLVLRRERFQRGDLQVTLEGLAGLEPLFGLT